MNAHPQLFDRQKPLILDPLIGHAGLGRHCARTSPRAFSRQAHGNSYSWVSTELEEVAYFGALAFFDVVPGLAHSIPGAAAWPEPVAVV